MSSQEINEAIAECCGWTKIPQGSKNPIDGVFAECPVCNFCGVVRNGRMGTSGTCQHQSEWLVAVDQWTPDGKEKQALPDYCGSLDAMAIAESTLTPDERIRYACQLSHSLLHEETFAQVFATAPQRADAFLRVKSRWQDEPAKGAGR